MVENPIASDLDCMRPSALPNLIQAAARNAARGHADAALFEIGPIYLGDQPNDQRTVIAGLIAPHAARHWAGAGDDALFALKADLMALLEPIGAPVSLAAAGARARTATGGTPAARPGCNSAPKTVIAEFGAAASPRAEGAGRRRPDAGVRDRAGRRARAQGEGDQDARARPTCPP